MDALRDPLAQLVAETGAEILQYYQSAEQLEAQTKADNTPVTEADIAAHHRLMEGLAPFGLPVLSEESGKDAEDRRNWDSFWMVDPLDGTKEFLGRTGEFTINIALIEGECAVFGLVAIPVSGEIYLGGAGLGAWSRRDGKWESIRSRPLDTEGTVTVLASRRHRGERLDACLEALRNNVATLRRDNAGSALKFCRLAAGDADFYPRYSPCSEWDTAAGQALLEGAGGAVLGLDGMPLRYNLRDTLLSPNFHAIADPAAPIWARLR